MDWFLGILLLILVIMALVIWRDTMSGPPSDGHKQ